MTDADFQQPDSRDPAQRRRRTDPATRSQEQAERPRPAEDEVRRIAAAADPVDGWAIEHYGFEETGHYEMPRREGVADRPDRLGPRPARQRMALAAAVLGIIGVGAAGGAAFAATVDGPGSGADGGRGGVIQVVRGDGSAGTADRTHFGDFGGRGDGVTR